MTGRTHESRIQDNINAMSEARGTRKTAIPVCRCLSILLILSLIALGGSVQAAFMAVSVPTSSSGDGSPTPQTVNGWRFTANEDLTVTHLGMFDYLDDGFAGEYELGLFRFSDMALLTSGSLPAGTVAPLDDHFRFVDVPDTVVAPGSDYVVTLFSPHGTVTDPTPTLSDRMFNDTALAFTVHPSISYIESRYEYNSGALVFPTTVTPANDARIGPNLIFIPEPHALTLASAALLGLLVAGRRRRA
jgi:hypothetical protein